MYKTFMIGAALTALTVIPSCPAPPAIVPLITAGTTLIGAAAGGGGAKAKRGSDEALAARQIQLPQGVSQHNLDECKTSMKGKNIVVTPTASDAFRVDGVPAPCMNLAAFFAGSAAPVPCGSACLSYSGLSAADAATLKGTVKSLHA